MPGRATLHRLVDTLPEEDVAAVERFLSSLATLDPLERTLLLAPPDDEPEMPEERAAVEEALRDRGWCEGDWYRDCTYCWDDSGGGATCSSNYGICGPEHQN